LRLLRISCLAAVVLTLAYGASAQAPAAGQSLIILPFENISSSPGLEWIGESFPEVLGQQMASPSLYVVAREDRLRAYDRAGIPATVHPSRATLYKISEQLDADYAVLGQFNYDGRIFSAEAQLLDLRHEKLLPAVTESGPLVGLIDIQTALAWDLLHQWQPKGGVSKPEFVSSAPPIRLDALENYVRGIMAATEVERIAHFREAARLNPAYNDAWLQLGKTYLGNRQYEQAEAALGHIQPGTPHADEANFYLGLAAYSRGDYAKAETAFAAVAARLPLAEVQNNLGVAKARRNKNDAAECFHKAVVADPNDADYHFNLALALARNGDLVSAQRQLHETVTLQPTDAEAIALAERLNSEGLSRGITTAAARLPSERIKRQYDENAFRQLALQVDAVAEQRLPATDPHAHARFHVARGDELFAQGFMDEAEKEFREAVKLDAGNAQAHAGLARVLENNSDLPGARAEAESALRLRQFAEPLLVLTRLDLRDNRTEAAAQSVDRALQLEPSNPQAQALKRTVAAKLAEKAQPLPNP
jgi:tetratricopeptide (TPR) repeat protein